MDKIWKVIVNIEVVFHVKAPTASVAEGLACDSLSSLHVTNGWKDCVELHDDFWNVIEITESGGK